MTNATATATPTADMLRAIRRDRLAHVAPIRMHHDRKTAMIVRKCADGEWETPRGHANAIALPAGPEWTCGGATEACVACYAKNGLEIRTNFKTMIHDALASFQQAGDIAGAEGIAAMMQECADSIMATATKFGVTPRIRFESDGDIYGIRYAVAIRIVMLANPELFGWLYTRSFNYAPYLLNADGTLPANLSAYVSVDSFNLDAASDLLRTYPAFRAAVLAQDGEDSARIFALLDRKTAPICPAAGGKYTRDGNGPSFITLSDGRRGGLKTAPKGTIGRGACDACGLCIAGRSDVAFLVHGRVAMPTAPAAPTCSAVAGMLARIESAIA